MAKNKYTIKYTETFVKQFNNILKYFIYKLQNKIAAENFYDEVIKEIEKRSEYLESFEKYNSKKKYILQNLCEELHYILYNKRQCNGSQTNFKQ